MADKVIIVVEDCRDYDREAQAFKVKSLTNTVDYFIGQWLTEIQVKDLCRLNYITVKIEGHSREK